MRRYDPLRAPDPRQWSDLGESQRLQVLRQFHRRSRRRAERRRIHAAIHVVVENQAALGDEVPVAAALLRLQAEGLDRHEALHAVGWVLSGYIYEALHGTQPDNDAYFAKVAQLTAQKWREAYRDAEEDNQEDEEDDEDV